MSRKNLVLWAVGGAAALLVVGAGAIAGSAALAAKQEAASLTSALEESRGALAALRTSAVDTERQLKIYQQIATNQQEEAHSLHTELAASIGDRLTLSEGIYTALPKTVEEARTAGYTLLDALTTEGRVLEAECFAHENALHFAQVDPKVTSGATWHGAPFLLIYSSVNGKLLGMVLESTSPQPSPPWESHPEGHPGMPFPHSSLHVWFTTPPKNLSLAPHTSGGHQ